MGIPKKNLLGKSMHWNNKDYGTNKVKRGPFKAYTPLQSEHLQKQLVHGEITWLTKVDNLAWLEAPTVVLKNAYSLSHANDVEMLAVP